MKKTLISALSILCLTYSATAAQAEETISIVADVWCPYNCEPGAKEPGFMIEIAQKAFAKHNIKIEYKTMPWPRAIEETRNGKYTAIVGSSQKDAPDFIFPEIQQGEMRTTFYVKKGNDWRYTGVKSLEKTSIGTIADYAYNDNIAPYISVNKNNPKRVQEVSGDDALAINIKKLIAGRIGALVDSEYVMNYKIKTENTGEKIEEAGSVEYADQEKVFIAFSPKNKNSKRYADILTNEQKQMRESGELDKILSEYNISDWQKK